MQYVGPARKRTWAMKKTRSASAGSRASRARTRVDPRIVAYFTFAFYTGMRLDPDGWEGALGL